MPALFFCGFKYNVKKTLFPSLLLSHIININHLPGFSFGLNQVIPCEMKPGFPTFSQQQPIGDSARFPREGCATSVPSSWVVISVFLFCKSPLFLGMERCLVNPRRDQGGHVQWPWEETSHGWTRLVLEAGDLPLQQTTPAG